MNPFDSTLQEFTELIVTKIESLEKEWSKPWINTGKNGNFIPQNISGRFYSHGNAFLLSLLCDLRQYETPVFLTFLQAKDLNLKIRKGARSFPVYYVCRFITHKEKRNRITEKEYNELTTEQKKAYSVTCGLKSYRVFNLDQTDYKEVYPAEWQVKLSHFQTALPDTSPEMYHNLILDELFLTQTWVCPIRIQQSNRAFFRPSEDFIQLPLKQQFKDGESFYATALHEMSHSTGTEQRLNRKIKNGFGTNDYGREELVAELSAAIAGLYLCVSTSIREENLTYLKSWLSAIRQEPKFLMSVLSDVSKAVKYILNHLGVSTENFISSAESVTA